MRHETSYHPNTAPNPSSWLALPEDQRIRAVHFFHSAHRLNAGKAKVHAAIHVVVENQIAMGHGPAVRAMQRLQGEGLSRHDALHAVGSVLATRMVEALRQPEGEASQNLQREIDAALEQLDAASWRKDHGA